MNENLIVYLIGPSGVGKATIGGLLAQQLPAKLVDNHYWLNPLLGLVEQDGVNPLPKHFWEFAARSRRVVMDTIIEFSPADWSFIFTHGAIGTGGAHDRDFALDITSVAEARKADLWAIQLTASADELARRVVMPERRKHMKEVDPAAARRNAAERPFDAGVRNTLLFDTTDMSPAEATRSILSKLQT